MFEPTQFGADVSDRGVGEKIRRRHRVLKRSDAKDWRIEIHVSVLDAVDAVEEHIMAGDNGALCDFAIDAADIDTDGRFQQDVLIFVKSIEVRCIEGIEANNERLLRIQLDELAIAVLPDDVSADDKRQRGSGQGGQYNGKAKSVQHVCCSPRCFNHFDPSAPCWLGNHRSACSRSCVGVATVNCEELGLDRVREFRSTRLMRGLIALLVLIIGLVPPVRAETPVDLELILAIDVSRSMTPRELEIQRKGYAEALVSPDVIEAIGLGRHRQIALMYIEWAGYLSQRTIVDWTLIRTRADAEAFAARLTAQFSEAMRRTSISGAIYYGVERFEGNGFAGIRQVIDISGDGPNNQGPPVLSARAEAAAHGVTINGLPLMTREGMGSQWHLDDLDLYYRDCVISGPTSFVIPVLEWEDFPAAVRRKLVLELVDRRPGAEITQPAEGYDCLIGERIWDEIMGDWN